MNNMKTVGKTATIFGVISVVFAAIAALLNYELNTYLYSPLVPAGFIQANAVSAMLPYLLVAVLSFAVSAIANAHARQNATLKTQTETVEPQPENQPQPTI